MAGAVHTGGVTRTLQGIYVRTPDGLQTVAVGRARTAANVLKLFFGSLSAALDTNTVFGRANSSLTPMVTTRAVTVTPSGGQEPYSYLWSMVSSDGSSWTINSPTSATTSFASAVGPGSTATADFHCVVRDAAGNAVTTDAVTATASNINAGGTGPLP